MKKLITLLSTLAFACTLSVPVFARAKAPKPAKAQDAAAMTKSTKSKKEHRKHARKHGTKEGKKTGQNAMTPGQATK
jgi:hypothetical protein